MASLNDLPVELLLLIADYIVNSSEGQAALSCLTRTSRSFRQHLLPTLFAYNAKHSLSSALRYGAVVGDADIIALALSHGAAVEASVDHFQVLSPHARQKVESYRARYEDDDTRHCLSPLSCACLYGHLDAARLLIQTGKADLESVDIMNRTPIFKAAKSGSVELVDMLLDGGAQAWKQDADGELALWPAIRWARTEVVDLLLSRAAAAGLDLNTVASRISPLALAASTAKDSTAIIEMLLRHGVDIAARDENGYQALDFAAQDGSVENLRTLIQHGADVNNRTSATWSALGTAVRHGRADVVDLLVAHGADVEAKDPHLGRTPLLVAVPHSEALPIVRTLVEKGHANVNQTDNYGRTALSYAVLDDDMEVARYLLEHAGADVDVADHRGLTPLALLIKHRVRSKVVVEIVKLLLSHGAHVDGGSGRANKALTPLGYALRSASSVCAAGERPPGKKMLELTRILVAAGADLQVRFQEGKTPLEMANMPALTEHMLRVAAETACLDVSKGKIEVGTPS